ncbi:hypothetical protein NM208_g16173 [Fusarium decemcellulare]|uniref:Uncharacterized protein n=1 Tax=Fusarium decemcellulare TaxID=57161 RepID=A0ACC1RDI2_9HYPO|nr:hypothetical protein NM208_g16173 [Fusarium decemcellulare]
MSNYNGRRGPNVSQYLRDLNAINRQEPSSNDEPFNMEEDLALFTNTQFFDFETGQNTDYQAHPVKVDMEAPPSTSPSDGMTPAPSVVGDLANFDFIQDQKLVPALLSHPDLPFLFSPPKVRPRSKRTGERHCISCRSLMGNEQRFDRFTNSLQPPPRLNLPLPPLCAWRASVIGDKVVSGCRPARVWPAWDRDLDLSGWIEDGVYGAISRDLPTPITTSTATPAPYPSLPKSERPLPQASWPLLQHQPFFNPPCLLSSLLLLVMTLDLFRPRLTTERWQVTLASPTLPTPIRLPP